MGKTSRERLIDTLNHRDPGKVVLDLGSSSITGININKNLDMDSGSKLRVNVAALGRAIGLYAGNKLLIEGADVDVDVKSYSVGEDKMAVGILCNGLNVTKGTAYPSLHSWAEDGTALIAGMTKTNAGSNGYDPTYEPVNIDLGGNYGFSVPENGTISSYIYKDPYMITRTLKGESVYNPTSTSAPAQEVRLMGTGDGGESLVKAREELTSSIVNANASLTNGSYTKESREALQKAIDAANEKLDNADATEADIKAAQAAVLQALRKLVPADKDSEGGQSVTEADIQRFKAIDALAATLTSMYENVNLGLYTKESVTQFKSTLDNASQVLEASDSSTLQLMKAKSSVLIARKNLVKKAANTIAAKGKTVKVKAKKVGKNKIVAKKKTIGRAKAFKTTNAQGKVTFAKVKGNKKISVSSSGKVVVKKGLKKGVYKVTVTVSAAGNDNYLPGNKNVTLKVRVK